MALIREWVITIISIIIFIAFVEILIPNSNYKRYINVIVGLLLMVVILTPLTKFINGEVDFESEIFKISNRLELSTAQNRINNIQYNNNEAVITLYKNEIGTQIKNHIEQNTECTVDKVSVEIEDDNNSPQFGLIKNIDIILKEKINDSESADKKIKPVQINVPTEKNSNNTVKANSILINNEEDLIKKDIGNLYNISGDNINIHVLKNN